MAPNRTEASTDATMPWITKNLAFVRKKKEGQQAERDAVQCLARNSAKRCTGPVLSAIGKTLRLPGARVGLQVGHTKLCTADVDHLVDKCLNKPARARRHWLCGCCQKNRQTVNRAQLLHICPVFVALQNLICS